MKDKKKHILVISQYFYPEQFRINDIASELVKRGYKVTVLTGIPNYPQGKFFDGYSWSKRRKDEWNGMNIIRIPLFARGHSAIGMVLNYVSFVISGFVWKSFTKVEADVVFTFEVSPMTQALIGVWYSKRKKIPNYLYVQDLWPENVEIVAGIHNKMIISAISGMVNYIYKNCTKIFATSPSFVKKIQERVEDKEKVVYWPQYAEDFYQPIENPPKLDDMPNDMNFKLIFTGNIGYAQGLDILPKTARLLKDKNEKCDFIIVGEGRYKEQLEREIAEMDVAEMFFMIGRKKPEDIPMYLANSDAAFLSFNDNELWKMTIPAKLQSYMACGMPIIAVAGGETLRVIDEAQCGFCTDFGNSRELVEFITGYKDISKEKKEQYSANSESYYKKHFNKQELIEWMLEQL